jgi:aspartate 1-decarboxylase
MRDMLKSKIHRATVTEANLDYVGSVTIDQDLLVAADIYENEFVDIWDLTNGNRISTYALCGPSGSGVICINGAAAHMIHEGDLVIIASHIQLDDEAAKRYIPRLVFVDEYNRIVETNITGAVAEKPFTVNASKS